MNLTNSQMLARAERYLKTANAASIVSMDFGTKRIVIDLPGWVYTDDDLSFVRRLLGAQNYGRVLERAQEMRSIFISRIEAIKTLRDEFPELWISDAKEIVDSVWIV